MSGTVVVLRALGLGDLLTALPALRGLRSFVDARLPEHRLLLAAPDWLEPVARLSGAVDGLVPTAPLGPVTVDAPALAVNLHGRGPQSTETLRRTRPDALWAFDLPGGCAWDAPEAAGSPAVPAVGGFDGFDGFDGVARGVRCGGRPGEEHESVRWCRLLATYGVTCDPRALDLPLPPVREQPPGAVTPDGSVTIVHPGGAAPARCWPARRWSRLAEALARGGHRVVVTGSAAERRLATQVTAAAGLGPGAVLAGRTDLLGLCDLVARARLLVAADTGIAHLATAYRTPSVVLFGPVPPARWGPPPDRPEHRALWAGRLGDPAAPTCDPGLLTITVDQVLREMAGR